MLRYIALSWNPESSHAASFARHQADRFLLSHPQWESATDFPGLTLLFSTEHDRLSRVPRIGPQGGYIFGRIFDRTIARSEAVTEISQAPAQEIVRTSGRSICGSYWGKFVALVRSPNGATTSVLRDPTGRVPVLLTKANDVWIFFSDAGLIAELSDVRFSISEDYLRRYLSYGQHVSEDTGFNNVTELYAGHCADVANGVAQITPYWDPQYFVGEGLQKNNDPASALRDRLFSVTASLASGSNGLGVLVSGGFDSAVILGALKKVAPNKSPTCVNFHTAHPEGDERAYARIVTKLAGLEMIESLQAGRDKHLDRVLNGSIRSTKPTIALFSAVNTDSLNILASQHGIDQLLNGRGGDEVFYRYSTPYLASDYLAAHGLSLGSLRYIGEIARRSKTPYIKTLLCAIGINRPDKELHQYRHTIQPFLKDLGDIAPPPTHPWLDHGRRYPAGKWRQVQTLAYGFNMPRSAQFGLNFVETSPILSEPIVELCLSVPTYTLAHRGESRTLAKRAFHDLLPPELLTRTSKGTAMRVFFDAMNNDPRIIKEAVLDGCLASRGLIDLLKVESFFDAPLMDYRNVVAMGDVFCTEAWLRHSNTCHYI